jgi:hypothetical protein
MSNTIIFCFAGPVEPVAAFGRIAEVVGVGAITLGCFQAAFLL